MALGCAMPFLLLLLSRSVTWGKENQHCYKQVDLIVILDGSGTVTQENWIKSLQFTRDLAAKVLTMNERNKIGLIDFSQIAREDIYLTSDNRTIEEGIKRMADNYQNGITRTELALEEAKRMFKMESSALTSKVLVTVTDGRTTPLDGVEGKDLISGPVTELKVMGVHMIAIGITNKINQEELNLLGTTTSDVLKIDDYGQLLKKVSVITEIACPLPTSKPTETAPTTATTPSTKTTPTTPSTPSIETTPTTPSTPSTETTPTSPSTPSTKTTPTSPSTPSTETTPTTPSTPSTETTPTTPSTPSTETTTATPSTPSTETTPTTPSTPSTETTPTTQTTPATQTTPTTPSTPSTETTPTTPTAQTTPATQTTPTTPAPNTLPICEAPYHKIGCFSDDQKDPRPLPVMLFTDRDSGSPVYSGKTVDWQNWEQYLVDIVCRCSKAAEEKGFAFFAIQYYGECWSGKDAGETYKRNGAASGCINTKNQVCSNDDEIQCAGPQDINYVYGRDITPRDNKCNVQYDKLGCFKDLKVAPRPLPDLILTDRDTTSPVYSGVSIDWGNWDTYLTGLVCRCAQKAAEAKIYQYFGIQSHGECWAGGQSYNRDGEGDTCITKGFQKCPSNPHQTNHTCAGIDGVNYVYGLMSNAPACEVKYQRVGCFNDNHMSPRPLPDLILTDRDSTSQVYSKQDIDWGDWDNYIRDLACRCARAAKNKRLYYFGLQYYGECWSGPESAETFAINGPSSNCVTDGFTPCQSESKECVGKEKTNSVYRVSVNVFGP